MLGSPRCGGISLKQTAWTPRPALRRTSAAARPTSQSGTILSGMQPSAAVAAPLLDHPVVVGDDAGHREVLVLGFEERLAAEARERREAQRGVHLVDDHVVDAGLRARSSRVASRRR